MSSYRKGADTERDLRDRLWDEGWAAAREAGSGSWRRASADIWAAKDGSLLVAEVVIAGGNESKLDKYVDWTQLEEIRHRVDGSNGDNARVVAIFRSPGEKIEWRYKEDPPYRRVKVKELDYLYELLNEMGGDT